MIQNKFKFFKRNKTVVSPNLKTDSRLKNASNFFNNSHYSLPIRLFVSIMGISFIILAITFKRLPPSIPLYYSLPWGEEQLAKPSDLFIIPFSIMIIFLLNLILSMVFLKRDNFLIQFLMWSSCLIALGGLITLTKIILLVI